MRAYVCVGGGGADVCICLTILVDVCQFGRLLMFVCLSLFETLSLLLNLVNKESVSEFEKMVTAQFGGSTVVSREHVLILPTDMNVLISLILITFSRTVISIAIIADVSVVAIISQQQYNNNNDTNNNHNNYYSHKATFSNPS